VEALLTERDFFIQTDHKSPTYLNEQNLHSDMERKAMTRLMGLQFRILYKKAKIILQLMLYPELVT
jgi:hypothetical protein